MIVVCGAGAGAMTPVTRDPPPGGWPGLAGRLGMMSEMLIQPPPLYLADVVRLNGPGYDYYEACVTH